MSSGLREALDATTSSDQAAAKHGQPLEGERIRTLPLGTTAVQWRHRIACPAHSEDRNEQSHPSDILHSAPSGRAPAHASEKRAGITEPGTPHSHMTQDYYSDFARLSHLPTPTWRVYARSSSDGSQPAGSLPASFVANGDRTPPVPDVTTMKRGGPSAESADGPPRHGNSVAGKKVRRQSHHGRS